MDYIGATPQQNPLMGLLAEKLKQAQEFAVRPFGYQNPPAEVLLNLLGVPAVQQTAERLAYGEPLTTGRGMTTKPRPEAVEAAMTVLPAAGLLGSAAERGAMAAGRAGERYAEKVVPQIMERGGLPAQLLGDLSQGSRRQIFIGPESPMYDKDAALKAAKMLKKDIPAQQVWAETGTLRTPAGEWMQEISDVGAELRTADQIAADALKLQERNLELGQVIKESQGSKNLDLFPKALTEARRPLKQELETNKSLLERQYGFESPVNYGNLAQIAYEHPSLYEAYPKLKGVVVRQGDNNPNLLGSYELNPAIGQEVGLLSITKEGLKRDPLSTTAHEMQHAIQELEGWGGGGNVDEFIREALAKRNEIQYKISDLNRDMSKAVGTEKYDKLMSERMKLTDELISSGLNDDAQIVKQANDKYNRLAGEAQSRLTQKRLNLTPEERRQYFPYEYKSEQNKYGLDVKPEDLIYRGQGGGGLLAESVPFQYPQEEALRLAQQRAALPKEQFGLGLPPDNTAKQRADAMFPYDVYHATNADIQAIKTAGKGKTSGAGAFVIDNPLASETYVNAQGGANIIPMRMSKEGLLSVNAKGRNWADIETNTLAPKAGKKRYSLDEMELQKNDVTSTDELGMIAKDLLGLKGVEIKNVKDLGPNSHIFRAKEYLYDKYGIIPDENWSNVTGKQFDEARKYMDKLYQSQKGTVTAVQDADLLRSRFAAFDPFRRTAAIAAAMGVAAPDLLAEERPKKKKKNLLD